MNKTLFWDPFWYCFRCFFLVFSCLSYAVLLFSLCFSHAFLVYPFENNNEGFAIDFCRIIKNHKFFYHHIGLYIYTHDSLNKFIKLKQSQNELKRNLEQMRAMDNNMKIKLVKVKEIPPSVDTLEDLKKIRLLFRKNK